jgi:3-methyladenine DNA glycosylase AlkC
VFADALYHGFNGNYPEGLEVLLQILGPENPKETGMFTEFYWLMPIAKYTEKYGLDDFAASMRAIEAITRRNTGEYAIRPFLLHHPERTMAQMLQWSTDASFHVRRLACEGLRPRLPWAKKLDMFSADPSPIIPILDNLKDDPSKYVQKSVANCLNDILKDNPAIGQSIVERWRDGAPGKARRWIIRHALRNLVKAKDPWARSIIASIENHDSR